jgi:hypothetical protein
LLLILLYALFIMPVEWMYWSDIDVTSGVFSFQVLVLEFLCWVLFYFPLFYLFTTLVTYPTIIMRSWFIGRPHFCN